MENEWDKRVKALASILDGERNPDAMARALDSISDEQLYRWWDSILSVVEARKANARAELLRWSRD